MHPLQGGQEQNMHSAQNCGSANATMSADLSQAPSGNPPRLHRLYVVGIPARFTEEALKTIFDQVLSGSVAATCTGV